MLTIRVLKVLLDGLIRKKITAAIAVTVKLGYNELRPVGTIGFTSPYQKFIISE